MVWIPLLIGRLFVLVVNLAEYPFLSSIYQVDACLYSFNDSTTGIGSTAGRLHETLFHSRM